MSDDEVDHELIALLRQHMLGVPQPVSAAEMHVLRDAEHIYNNAIDVALDSQSTKRAAACIWDQMQERQYSTKTWSEHELHPQSKDEATVAFIFTMDLLNFSFWSERASDEADLQFAIEYRGRRWTGYWSLVAALQRALDEDIPITSSDFWQNEIECSDEVLRHVFRSATDDPIPLFDERVACLREAGQVLYEKYSCSVINLLNEAGRSAPRLVNLLAEDFACFRDETRTSSGKKVRFLKRAQIFVADLWACFNGESYGEFDDIEKITIFADYRIPQMLNHLGALMYGPTLASAIVSKKCIESGSNWEIEIRGCTIWCVELIRREIIRQHPDAQINAILIDFYLYDAIKEKEDAGQETMPHHRTRSIWY